MEHHQKFTSARSDNLLIFFLPQITIYESVTDPSTPEYARERERNSESLLRVYTYVHIHTYIHSCMQWNLYNPDTSGTEESVNINSISGIKLHARTVQGVHISEGPFSEVQLHSIWEKRCPYWRGVLISGVTLARCVGYLYSSSECIEPSWTTSVRKKVC